MEQLKRHDLKVRLTDEEYQLLKDRAQCYSVTASQLIEAFICDLVYSDRRGGSDESEIANHWHERNRYRF